MKRILAIVSVWMLLLSTANSQLTNPWLVLDGGGGKSSGTGLTLLGSIGQTAAGHSTGTGFILEGGYIPGVAQIAGTTSTLNVSMQSAWNLISLPVIPPDRRKSILFPTAISNAFAYIPPPVGYAAKDTLFNGRGYWLKFPGAQVVGLTGTTTLLDTVTVAAGWNIIGTISYPVLYAQITPVGGLTILSSTFGFANGVGYFAEDTLKPGLGYWVKVNQAGKLALKPATAAVPTAVASAGEGKNGMNPSVVAKEKNLAKLTIRDQAGRERILFFGSKEEGIEKSLFELPPPPPAGVLDARFASQSAAVFPDQRKGMQQSFPVLLAGAEFPVTIEWDVPAGSDDYALVIERPSGTIRSTIQGSGSTVLNDGKYISMKLEMALASGVEVPKEFALSQNYPNPFNPSAKIRVDLPRDVRASLKVYNLLGQEVLSLMDEEKKAGSYVVELNASALPSGVYFYRLSAAPVDRQDVVPADGRNVTAEDFSMTRKFVLMK